MASVTRICNIAIAHCGTPEQIQLITETGNAAQACNLHFEQLRDEMQGGSYNWRWNKRRQTLADLGAPPDEWAYRYAYPDQCLKFREIYQPTQGSDPIEFELEGGADAQGNDIKVILTNQFQAIGIFSRRVTNTELWSPSFTMAFAWQLAAKICKAITGDDAKAKDVLNTAMAFLRQAQTDDANEGFTRHDPVPQGLRVRGITSMTDE